MEFGEVLGYLHDQDQAGSVGSRADIEQTPLDLAMIERAKLDFESLPDWKNDLLAMGAWTWVFFEDESEHEWLYSFPAVCGRLGFDASAVRAAFRATFEASMIERYNRLHRRKWRKQRTMKPAQLLPQRPAATPPAPTKLIQLPLFDTSYLLARSVAA